MFDNNDEYISKFEDQIKTSLDEFEQCQSKISNIVILYSAIFFFLFPVLQDLKDLSIQKDRTVGDTNILYLLSISLIAFLVFFIPSIIHSYRLIRKDGMKTLPNPKAIYVELRNAVSAAYQTDDEINEAMTLIYTDSLDDILRNNRDIIEGCKELYSKAVRRCMYGFIPFLICIFIHLWVDNQTVKNKIVNLNEIGNFTKDTLNLVIKDSSCNKEKRRYYESEKRKIQIIRDSYNSYYSDGANNGQDSSRDQE